MYWWNGAKRTNQKTACSCSIESRALVFRCAFAVFCETSPFNFLVVVSERERKNESFSFRHYAVSGACLFIFHSFFKGSWLHLIQSLALCSHTHTTQTLARNSMIILLQRFIVFGPCRKELANFSSSTVETPMADFGVVFTVLLLVRRRSSLVVHISFVPSSKAYGIDQK